MTQTWVELLALKRTLICSLLVAAGSLGVYLWRVRRDGRWSPRGTAQWASSLALWTLTLGACASVAIGLRYRWRGDDTAARLQAAVGKVAPPLTFTSLRGERLTLEALRGKVVIVNLWATWCPPCVFELPALSRLQEVWGARGVHVVGISDEPAEVVQAFAKRRSYAHVLGTAALGEAGEPWSLVVKQRPLTFLVDEAGYLRETFVGVHDFDHFDGRLKGLLGEPASGVSPGADAP